MSDTAIITKAETNGKDSTFFGVSIRAWLAFILVMTIAGSYLVITVGVVVDAILTKDWSRVGTFANVGEPLYSLVIMSVSFYFGTRTATPKP